MMLTTSLLAIQFSLAVTSVTAFEWEGYDHIIEFDNAKVILRQKPDRRDCYFDVGNETFFFFGGRDGDLQTNLMITHSKKLLQGIKVPQKEPKFFEKNPEIPIQVNYQSRTDSQNITVIDKIERFTVHANKTLRMKSASWALNEAICSGEALTFRNKYGGTLHFSSNDIKTLTKPFFAWQSCIRDSDKFQFENRSSNFMKYDKTARECWWE